MCSHIHTNQIIFIHNHTRAQNEHGNIQEFITNVPSNNLSNYINGMKSYSKQNEWCQKTAQVTEAGEWLS